MTLFFSLENLEKESNDDINKFMLVLETFYRKRLPSKRKKIPAIKLNLAGFSYILNPEPLFGKETKNIDIAYKIQYVKLAARRDYGLYKHYKVKTLPLSYFPDINMQAIRTNPLLKITQTEIFFLYEEMKKENKWH